MPRSLQTPDARWLVGAVLILASVRGPDVNAAPPARVDSITSAELELARAAMDAVWKTTGELKSGVLRAHETYSSNGKRYTETHDLFLAFDYEHDCVRFDHGWTANQGDEVLLDKRVQFARNLDEQLFHHALPHRPNFISRYGRDRKLRMHDAQPPDMRLMGLAGGGIIRDRRSLSDLRKLYDTVGTRFLAGCEREDENIVRLVWLSPAGSSSHMQLRRTLRLDESLGLRPVGLKLERKDSADADWVMVETTQTTWERWFEHCVPVKCSMVWWPEGQETEGTLVFVWKSVNDGIDPKLLRIEGFDLPVGTRVWDNKGGKAVLERTVGKDSGHKMNASDGSIAR